MNQHPNFPLRANQPTRDAQVAAEAAYLRQQDEELAQRRAMREIHETATPWRP